jgi:AcrR family transcriptional regulator
VTEVTATEVTPTPRVGRRDAILEAAATLFSSRGYAETGIDDIGGAAGVTGPAVYRHYASKEDLLVAVLQRAVDHAAAIVPRARAEAASPHDALDRLVDASVTACIEDRALTSLYWQHSHLLPEGPRTTIERAQREMIEEYAEILRGVRPELSPSEARMAAHAVGSLMRSVAQRETSLGEERLFRLISSMARGALGAAEPDATASPPRSS